MRSSRGNGWRFLVVEGGGKVTGMDGRMKWRNKKGMWWIWNRSEEMGVLMVGVKRGKESYTERGN